MRRALFASFSIIRRQLMGLLVMSGAGVCDSAGIDGGSGNAGGMDSLCVCGLGGEK